MGTLKRVDKSKSWKRHNGTATTNMNNQSSIRFGVCQNDVEQTELQFELGHSAGSNTASVELARSA